MNPKFKKGDLVYLNDRPHIVMDDPYPSIYGYLYSVLEHLTIHPITVYEYVLMSQSDWEARQYKNTQNHVGWAAFNAAHDRDMAVNTGKIKEGNGCVCGAHKVKDARHSTWCDIKN